MLVPLPFNLKMHFFILVDHFALHLVCVPLGPTLSLDVEFDLGPSGLVVEEAQSINVDVEFADD